MPELGGAETAVLANVRIAAPHEERQADPALLGGTDFARGVREGLAWSLLEGEGRRQCPSITEEMT